ncbi:MAG: Fur family transcriptional regulator [Pseudomonadales bacterium]
MASTPQNATSTGADPLLEHAEEVCRDRGVSFTPIRREVFELLCRHDRPVGAYELLDELKATRPRAAPVTVYRALDFLLEAGLAHKINALNAFTACRGSDQSHKGLMLICSKCLHVIELEDSKVENSIRRSAADRSFETRDEPVEVVGTCSDCRA